MIVKDYLIRQCNKIDLKQMHQLNESNLNCYYGNNLKSFSHIVKNNICYVLEKKEKIYGYVIVSKINKLSNIIDINYTNEEECSILLEFIKTNNKKVISMIRETDLERLIFFKNSKFKSKLIKNGYENEDGVLMEYVSNS